MTRIKVITEPAELVPVFRAVDTKVKREVLKLVTLEWHTMRDIEKQFGPAGKDALHFFEKMKLAGDVAEVLGVTFTMLKSLVKRSTKLDYRGHRIERLKE